MMGVNKTGVKEALLNNTVIPHLMANLILTDSQLKSHRSHKIL